MVCEFALPFHHTSSQELEEQLLMCLSCTASTEHIKGQCYRCMHSAIRLIAFRKHPFDKRRQFSDTSSFDNLQACKETLLSACAKPILLTVAGI